VVEAATEVLQAVMHHVSAEAIYVRKALLLMREARAKHATDLKVGLYKLNPVDSLTPVARKRLVVTLGT
jgi:hypothetical protein